MVMHERSISKKRYIFAGVLTLLIFSLGVMLGLVIESKRVELTQKNAEEQRLDLSSLQLQYAYIDQLAQEKNCPALAKNFDKDVEVLEQTRATLENYYKASSVNKEEFKLIRREYTIAQFNYWLLAKKYKSLCNANLSTVLFFYDEEKKCPDCSDQGYVLTYLKNIFNDQLLVFAIYGKYEPEPMVEIIKRTYNISEYPTLVIEDDTFTGFMGEDEVKEQVCRVINNTHEAC